MRARYPDRDGYVEREGTKAFYEVFGRGEPTILLLPTWSIIHSRHWKMQVPYLARHYRVVTFDGRGNGRSDRPTTPEAYADREFVDDAVAVMDATETSRAVVVGFSNGGRWALQLAAWHPERVLGLAVIGPMIELGDGIPWSSLPGVFDARFEVHDWWAKYNRHHWLADYPDFVRFFMSQMFTEPHSTKQVEDAVGWALETTPETLILTAEAYLREPALADASEAQALAEQARCPVLVIHGEDDGIVAAGRGIGVGAATGGTLALLEGSGHAPHARDPVKVNLLLREFIDRIHPPAPRERPWIRGKNRPKRALYISSPIGLGHARRDVAIADEVRRIHPDLDIRWLAQYPVTKVLEERGERIHPASAEMAAEVAHIDSEQGEHDLHCFQALRRMDEILLANFMLLRDLVNEEDYDLWIGDEAWELDYYLHENPEQKTAAYCWLTDFVGWLPMADGGEHEAYLTADYNAEMIEQIARFPRVRDRAIFVGAPRTSSRTGSEPTCPSSASGPRSTSTSRGTTSRGSIPPTSPTGKPGARSSGTVPTRRCAS
jgi:pimeloyl-ACP methyl ester carboxylesterase